MCVNTASAASINLAESDMLSMQAMLVLYHHPYFVLINDKFRNSPQT